jgi:hypothetical protein
MTTPSFKVNIAFQNVSTVVTLDDLTKAVAALQTQVSDHFGPIYDVDANLYVITDIAALSPGDWLIVVSDDSDQADALGYHELTQDGQPLGKVFAKSDKDDGLSWTVTASHELLELLADPWANLLSFGADGLLRAYEVCDAVEDDSLGYEINDVKVSDFVLPAWFNSTPGPYDYKGHCDAPLKLLSGGYIGEYVNGTWTQVTQDDKGRAPRKHRRFAIRTHKNPQ